MLKRWFDFSSNGNGYHEPAVAAMQAGESADPPRPAPSPKKEVDVAVEPPKPSSEFDQIYQRAGVRGQAACGILKVVDMVQSPHLAGMSPEGKRCAVRMALDAVGATVEGVLQDGVIRQGVLNDYEKEQQEKLRRFEETKAEENRKLQAELDRLTHDFLQRMQSAMDEVSREQDQFRAWQKRKQQEMQRIAEAAALCVPESMGSGGHGLSAVLERACAVRA
jgi:hypothetical protein